MTALASFFVFATLVSSVLGQGLTLNWPKYPENQITFTMTWSGGTPPYNFAIESSDKSSTYYTYTGTATSTSWQFTAGAGNDVIFSISDAANDSVVSPPVEVLADTDLHYPTSVTSGTTATLTWTGGVAPYTVNVLSADQTTNYYKYTGSALTTSFPMNIPAGTSIVFQLVDDNNVKATTPTLTVGAAANPSASLLSAQSVLSVESLSILSTQSLASLASQTKNNGGSTTSGSSTSSPASISSPTSAGQTTSTQTLIPTGVPSNSSPASTNSSPTSAAPSPTSSNKSSSNTGAIAGGVVGGVLGLALIGIIAFFVARRGHSDRDDPVDFSAGAGAGGYEPKPTVPDVGDPFYSAAETPYHNTTSAAAGGYGGGAGAGSPRAGDYAQSVATGGAAGLGAGAAYYGAQNQQQQPPYSPSQYPSQPYSPTPGSQNYAQSQGGASSGAYNNVPPQEHHAYMGDPNQDAYGGYAGSGITGGSSLPYTGTPGPGSPPPAHGPGAAPGGFRGLPEV